jgi:hypothetical protein
VSVRLRLCAWEMIRSFANFFPRHRMSWALWALIGGGIGVTSAGELRETKPMAAAWGIDACLSRHVPEEAWPAYLELLRASGVRTLRERDIGTREADGSYRNDVRPAYRRLQEAGHRVVAFAGTQVPVQQIGNALPEDLRSVFAQAKLLGRDFAGLVDAWEMVGEPDVGYCPDLPDRAVAYQKALYLGIKAGAREARWARGGEDSGADRAPWVLMGAVALPPGPWLERAVRNGMLDYTDAYNFHFYGHADDLTGVVRAHARVAGRHGGMASGPGFHKSPGLWRQRPQVAELPLWITECGLNAATPRDFSNPERRRLQAEFTVRTAQVAWEEERVALFMPFILAHEGDAHAMTLAGGGPLPAWSAYAEFTRSHPWPSRPLADPPAAPNPIVMQWMPDNRTTRAHKVSGSYRFLGEADMVGELRVYNFSERTVTGRLTESVLQRISSGQRLPKEIEVAAGGMVTLPMSFRRTASRGYLREDWSATFTERGGRSTAVSFALEAEPAVEDFVVRPWPIGSLSGTAPIHPFDPRQDKVSSVSGRWRGVNGVHVEELAEDMIRVMSPQLARDPLRARLAVARVGPLPTEGFLRLQLDQPMGQEFAVCVDLVDRQGQRFSIWENMGVSYFTPKATDVWLSLRDFQIYFWGRCSAQPVVRAQDVEELQFRFYGNKGDELRSVKFSVMVPKK